MGRALYLLAAALACVLFAHAQAPRTVEAAALTPESWAAKSPLRLRLSVGSPERALSRPWRREVAWAFVRVDGSQRNFDAETAPIDDDGTFAVDAGADGVHRVGVDLLPILEPGPKKNERFEVFRSASVLVRVGGGREPSPISTAKTGQAAEIRPLMDPTAMPTGSDLPFRLYAEGTAIGGATMIATAPSGRKIEVRTDQSAIGALRISETGVWKLEFQVAVPAARVGGPTKLFCGTLVFKVPDSDPGGAR